MKRKYGLDWPAAYNDVFIDLTCAKKWREYPYRQANLDDPGTHLLRACRALFTPEEFTISPWTEQHADDFTKTQFCITWGGAACSKAQPLDALVITPQGPREMGQLCVGDHVIAQDGQTAEILKTHYVGVVDEYRVSFRDGTSTLCAGDHLWEVEYRGGTYRRPRLMTTIRLMDFGPGKLSIPFCEPVYQEKRPLSIDPYVLGCLLGDGSMGPAVGFTNVDADVLAALRTRLREGYDLVHSGASKAGYRVVKADRGKASNWYINKLKELGLWGRRSHDKFVPQDYLFNEERHRRDLLAGLLDTDGCVDKSGRISFSSVSPQLASDVAALVRSLGGMAIVNTYRAGYTKAGVRVECRDVNVVNISMRGDSVPFKCGRKRSRLRSDRKITTRRYIAKVEPTGRTVPMKCITIDHPRGLYVVNDYIVTHNSNDYGLFLLLDWIVDPTETVTLMASTTREMLKIRSYESVIRYFQLLKRNQEFLVPGKESKTTTAIINVEDSEEGGPLSTIKASIRGVAVNDGGSIQGAHLPYVRLCCDELAEMKPHAMDARANLSMGCRDFRLFGLANPTSFYDEASKYSVPLDGWASVSADTEMWETRWGRVRHHNGFKSPAIVEPGGAEKYPYLINQEQIDKRLREEDGNVDARDIWVFVRGFPPRSGIDDTVLTPELIHTHKMQDPVVWLTEADDLEYCAGLDPAFTSGGDDCFMKVGAVGVSTDRVRTLAFVDTVRIPIDASSARPATYQVVDGVRTVLEKYNIPVNRLAVDDSGTQSVADVVAVEIGPGVLRVNNAQSATGEPLSPTDPTPADTKYTDRGTELWIRLALLGRQGALRGLTDRAANEFCIRRLVTAGKRKRLERKTEFKMRLKGHRSPDDGDASALCVFAARSLVGSSPQLNGSHGPGYPLSSGGSTGRPRIISSLTPGNYVDVDGWRGLSSYVGSRGA